MKRQQEKIIINSLYGAFGNPIGTNTFYDMYLRNEKSKMRKKKLKTIL